MKLKFAKMHGCGNDFVLIDGRGIPAQPWKSLAPRLLDRRFGVGGDQLLVLLPSETADVRMVIFERDMQESEMCGNGIRCAARYLLENGAKKKTISFETLAGKKNVEVESFDRVRVDMGKPVFSDAIWGKEIEAAGKKMKLHALSMGNPHAVIFLDSIDDLSWVSTVGPAVETNPLFPQKTNVGLVFVRDQNDIAARIWERGAGETFACGTGACACAAASIRENKVKSPVRIHFKGGTLEIAWKPGESVFMTGPATHVYSGEFDV